MDVLFNFRYHLQVGIFVYYLRKEIVFLELSRIDPYVNTVLKENGWHEDRKYDIGYFVTIQSHLKATIIILLFWNFMLNNDL